MAFEPLDFTKLSGSTRGGSALSLSPFRTRVTRGGVLVGGSDFQKTALSTLRPARNASGLLAFAPGEARKFQQNPELFPRQAQLIGRGQGTAGGTSQGALSDTLAQQRREIEDSIQQAFEANLLSEAEKNQLLTESREEIEAQVERSRQRLVESGFGRANIGAVRRELIGLEGTRIGEIAGARRDINQLQLDRARQAAEGRTRSLIDIQSLPPAGSSREELNIAQGSRLPTSTLRERLLQDVLASRERFGLSTAS